MCFGLECVCVFVLRQYLVVVFRDKPLELWDIRTGTLLREMAKNFPTVTALVPTNPHHSQNLATESQQHLQTSPVHIFACIRVHRVVVTPAVERLGLLIASRHLLLFVWAI